MFGKLLSKDLKKNMRWLWVLFLATIVVAGVSRGCKELGQTIMFFKILGIFFESVFYSLAVNVILQPFMRSFLNFSKSLYGDESYLTHTLPVTKSQLINSKFLTALIELVLGFATVVVSVLIVFASPTAADVIKLLISTVVSGEFSLFWVIALFVILVIVEFYMYISIIFLAIVIANRAREKRVLKAFLYTAALSFSFLIVLAGVMLLVLLANGVALSNLVVLSSDVFITVMLTGIAVYSLATLLCYILTHKIFKKGVNVD